MANYNQNSGYGQMTALAAATLAQTMGKLFVVADSAAAAASIMKDIFGPDTDGKVRYYASVDAAINQTTASRGDVIAVAAGHTETFTGAAGFALDVAGVSVIGLGSGNMRPKFTITSTDNSGTITQSGDNTVIKNIVVVTNDDGLTNAVVVSGDNCVTEFEHQDTSAAVEAATVVRGDTANNWQLTLKHIGFPAGNAGVSCVRLDDCDNVRINIDAYGIYSTAMVEMVDVASTNVLVNGYMYLSGTTDGSKDVVDTITGSTWFSTLNDGAAGTTYSGGSGAAFASDDVSALSAKLNVPTADVTTNSAERDVIGNKTDAAVTAVGTTKSIAAYAKGLVTMNTVQQADSTNNAFAGDVIGNKTDAAVADTVEGAAMTTQSDVAKIKAVLQRIGADSANNTAATTLVTANADGSLFERAEYIQTDMLALPRCVEKSDGAVLSGDDVIFNITGGPIHVLEILGIVTTQIGAGTTNVKLQIDTATPAATVDISAAAVDIDADAAGTSYETINTTGIFTPVTAGYVKHANSFATNPTDFIAPIGDLVFNSDAARAGVIKWYLRYIPLSPNSRVVAAA